jgi:hypothetical protein
MSQNQFEKKNASEIDGRFPQRKESLSQHYRKAETDGKKARVLCLQLAGAAAKRMRPAVNEEAPHPFRSVGDLCSFDSVPLKLLWLAEAFSLN